MIRVKLPPLQCPIKKRKKWSCHLYEDWFVLVSRLRGRGEYSFWMRAPGSGSCREWVHLSHNGLLTIRRGYATDGCSMVPDFPNAMPGCVVYDALRQASEVDYRNCPWNPLEADVIFLEVMKGSGANVFLRWTYYLGVAGPTGWAYLLWKYFSVPFSGEVCSDL